MPCPVAAERESTLSAATRSDSPAPARVTVGRIARAHGIHGEVSVVPLTDAVEERFAPGALLHLDSGHRTSGAVRGSRGGPGTLAAGLHVERVRWHHGRLLIAFTEVGDRTTAETLRGLRLTAPASALVLTDPDEFLDRELIGMSVVAIGGADVGTVSDVVHLPGQDLLAVTTAHGESLIPFVAAIVPRVDRVTATITIDPPPGLLDLGRPGSDSPG